MEYFYRKHLKEGLPPTQALRAAQLWLRDAARRELGDYYQSFLGKSPAALEAFTEIMTGGPPDEKPYANPFYWAAFTFTGA